MASPVGRQLTGDAAARERADAIVDCYDRYQGELFGYLTRFAGSRDVAEDLVQETFLRLVRELRAGRSPADVRPWLYRVATNLARSRGRHLAVIGRVLRHIRPADVDGSPEAGIVRTETRDELRRAVDHLAPDARSAVLLAAQGFSGPEIATILGRSQLATRSLLFRARHALRTELAGLEVRP